MRDFVFHVANGPDDYGATVSIWPKRFGDFLGNCCAETTVANAIRNGGLVLARDKSDDSVVGATILDLTTYHRSLFVPLNWIKDDDEDRAQILRNQLEVVIKTLILSGLERLLVIRDKIEDDDRAINEFNDLAQSYDIPLRLHVLCNVPELFGKDKTVSITSLFIQACNRPDLVSNVVSVTKAAVDSVFRSARGTVSAAFCIGWPDELHRLPVPGRARPSDKHSQKGPNGTSPIPFMKLSPEKGSVDAIGVFDLYNKVGIRAFKRYNQSNHFVPLV